jgi:tetratricopeptide (TPR) repeat protein
MTLYPAIQAELPSRDPPLTHSYSRILREAERGIYIAPNWNSLDFLEHTLPFLAYYPPFSGRSFPAESYLAALPDLEKAVELNRDSVLAAYFLGIVHEHTGGLEKALAQYYTVWEAFPDAYPAALGFARIMTTQGRNEEAVRFLYDLSAHFPDNTDVKRQLAIAYYNSGDWLRADAVTTEILQHNSRDGEFLLMRAHILVEQGAFLQAQAPLDIYSSVNPTNSLYLFLRARIQHEAFNNKSSALGFLRTILRTSTPADTIYHEVAIYTARLLMESSQPQEQAEGRALLNQILSAPNPPLNAVSLALGDAIRRESWTEARTYLARLLAERRSSEYLLAAYTVESVQGNNAAAFSYARELFERDPANEEGAIAYISALIEIGRIDEAVRMIDERLDSMSGGELKSRYHFLRSRTRDNEEMVLNDLRSSLFEDPRNLNALIVSFEIFHRRNDERRAVFYLRQALALAPDNLRLMLYAEEYNL